MTAAAHPRLIIIVTMQLLHHNGISASGAIYAGVEVSDVTHDAGKLVREPCKTRDQQKPKR